MASPIGRKKVALKPGEAPQALALPPGYLYGDAVKSRRFGDFALSERCYPPRFETPSHAHREALIAFVIQGNYTETYERQTRECKASTLIFHPPNENHAEHFHESGGRSFIVEIEPEWLWQRRGSSSGFEDSRDFGDGVLEVLARKLYREFLEADDASVLIVEGLLLQLVGEMLRRYGRKEATSKKIPRWLEQAKELIRARYSEQLTLSAIAAEVSVHPVHLAQTFSDSFHCTVGEYLRRVRIEYARQQLATSRTAIAEIALAAGFCDQSHFTRHFKRHTGMSPAHYRSLCTDK